MLLIKIAIGLTSMAVALFGVLWFLAGGMSDDPQKGRDAAKTGAAMFVGGVVVAVLCGIWIG